MWHLDDPDWRDNRIMQMAEWHPHFRKVERRLACSVRLAIAALKDYSVTLLSETTDDPEDLLRHLDEEVVAYIAAKLLESVPQVWDEAKAVAVRPNSPVREFEKAMAELEKVFA